MTTNTEFRPGNEDRYREYKDIIVKAMLANHAGEPYDEDAAFDAIAVLVGANLVEGGMSIDQVEDLLLDSDNWEAKATITPDGDLSINVKFNEESESDVDG